MSEYRVKFEVFEGPLDLLLHLVRKQEVDIYQVNLARIATDFVAYLEQMRDLDLDIAGEFLVMAATLVYIKSRELLPVDKQVRVEVDDEDGDDPRWELIRRLVEYKKFKEAAGELQVREGDWEKVYERKPLRPNFIQPDPVQRREPASIFDLVHAVSAILKRYRDQSDFSEIDADPFTVSEKIETLREMLGKGRKFRFGDLFQSAQTRTEVVVTFLALLELIRMRQIACVQTEVFGEIEIESSSDELVPDPSPLPPADFVEPTPIPDPDHPPDTNPLSTSADQPQVV
jgi:segregation and condensation protein A